MSDQGLTTLFVPLRSNASGLLAGAPVHAVRRHLKQASLFYDRIILEAGALQISAGEHGSVATDAKVENFQSPASRRTAQQGGFQVSIGTEDSPGRVSRKLRPALQSTTSISWQPTLMPFGSELPPECDWFEYARVRRDPAIRALADSWTAKDRANDALLIAEPEHFVRELIIKNANRDLAIAALSGMAIMQDAKHRQVVTTRLDSTTTWHWSGFAVPILLPNVSQMPWSAIATIRGDRAMRRYSSVLRDLEQEALAGADDGDLERATHRVFERYLADAAVPTGWVGGIALDGVASLFLGASVGLATSAWTGVGGVLAGAGIGAVIDVGRAAVASKRARTAKGWITLHQQLSEEP